MFAVLAFRAWLHPVPAFNANDGPVGLIRILILGWRVRDGVPLVGFSAALAATGAGYLAKVRPSRGSGRGRAYARTRDAANGARPRPPARSH
jgi:hypothetical protein